MTDPTAAPAPGTPAAPAPGAAPAAPAPGAAPAAPPAAFTPTQAPWQGDQVYTIAEKPWWNTITEEPVRQLMETKQYKNPAEVAMAYANANKMVNLQPHIQAVIEGKATPEQEASFYNNVMGRPESPDKYEFKPVEGLTNDPAIEKLGKEIFHELGANPKKAEAAYNKWQEGVKTVLAAQETAKQEANTQALTKLSETWGVELEANKAAGQRVMNSLVASKLMTQEEVDAVGNDIGSANVVKLLAAIGKLSGEGTFKATGNQSDPNNPATMTKEQAQAKITELQADETFQKKYKSQDPVEREPAVKLMEQLFAKVG